MAQQSSIARLRGMYRTVGAYRGQTGTPWSTSPDHRPFLGGWLTGTSRPSRWLSAASISATPLVREASDRDLPQCAQAHRLGPRGPGRRVLPITPERMR
jgi:hypothetical protein